MIYWSDTQAMEQIKSVLKDDRVLLASGDTVLGLWCNVTEAAFYNLNTIKKRSGMPYLITIASADRLSEFTDQILTDTLQNLIATCWPGPVTLIFKAKLDLPKYMIGSDGTIALRVPDHEGLLKILPHFKGLFSTSANIHGQPVVNCLDQIDPFIEQQVGLICLDAEQECYSTSPSTILDCSSGRIKVVRSGAFKLQDLPDLLS